MKKTHNVLSGVLDRRAICKAIVGLVCVKFATNSLPHNKWLRTTANADDEFVLLDGWVLTRKDLIGVNKVTLSAV